MQIPNEVGDVPHVVRLEFEVTDGLPVLVFLLGSDHLLLDRDPLAAPAGGSEPWKFRGPNFSNDPNLAKHSAPIAASVSFPLVSPWERDV